MKHVTYADMSPLMGDEMSCLMTSVTVQGQDIGDASGFVGGDSSPALSVRMSRNEPVDPLVRLAPTSTLEDASDAVLLHFEIPGGAAEMIEARRAAGREALAAFL